MKKLLIFSICIILSVANYASKLTKTNNKPNNYVQTKEKLEPMNKLYEKLWKEVDSLIDQGLPKSALEKTEIIYNKAKAENNAAQIVKSSMYRWKLREMTSEEGIEKIIDDCRKEATLVEEPVKQFMHSILADLYWKYFNSNRYYILNRTETVNFDNTDIKTWDLKKFVEKVKENYELSLMNPSLLAATTIEKFNEVIVSGANTKGLRPTLYDFLLHRAIDFYANTQSSLTKPSEYFEISSPDYFLPYEQFALLKIETKDTFSFKYQAIKLFQELTKLNLNAQNKDIIIDNELKRLKFVYNSCTLEEKRQLYLNALIELENKFKNVVSSNEIAYEIAQYYYNEGYGYTNKQADKEKQWLLVKAYDKCKEILANKPSSRIKDNTEILLEKILEKNLSMEMEAVNLPDRPMRALLEYRNVNKIFVKIYRRNYKDWEAENNLYSSDRLAKYLKLKPFMEYAVELPDVKDYQKHQVEFKIPELAKGYYLIMVSNNEKPAQETSIISLQHFWVSEIAYQQFNSKTESIDLFFKNRTDGTPLKNATVNAYYQEYNYTIREYVKKKWKTFTTDALGYLNIPPVPENQYSRTLALEIITENDYFHTDYAFYRSNYYKPTNYADIIPYFFTDRKIYRPGQTLYFKTIVLEAKGDTNKVKPNYPISIVLYDVNWQKVKDTTLKTNEFGTVSGSFVLPSSGLTGQMSLFCNGYYHYFSVEEYKRPTFEVNFKPIQGAYKLGEEVTVVGNAKAFSGVAIDNASVKYRIERYAYYPYYYGYRYGYGKTNKVEIKNGIINTKDDGSFEIKFIAKPDASFAKENNPMFSFTIYAEVTDINGETRTSKTNVNVGYTALMLNCDIAETVDKNETQSFILTSTNLSGEPEPCKVKVKVCKLSSPDRIIRKSYWNKPDTSLFTETEYLKLFPSDSYNDDMEFSNWKETETVFNKEIATQGKDTLKIESLPKWSSAVYKFEFTTKDKFGTEIKLVKYANIYTAADKKLSYNQPFLFASIKDYAEPNEKASFLIGSSYKNAIVMMELIKTNDVLKREYITLNNEQKIVEIPVVESYRGNIAVQFSMIYDNRSYVESSVIIVPYSNKELNFEYITFRNKLEPGQDEEWKIKITGKNKEKVTAEMLASMYDASLDAFKPNTWTFNYLKYYYNERYLAHNKYFEKTNYSNLDMIHYPDRNYRYYQEKQYDYLNWFGFYFGYYGYQRYEYDGVFEAVPTSAGRMRDSDGQPKKPGMKKSAKAAMVAADSASPEAEKPKVEVDDEMDKKEEPKPPVPPTEEPEVKVRTNFNETAFFYPQLMTDEEGNVIVSFKLPESLTKWKFMALAHTKDLKSGITQKEIVAQKTLMVVPNLPRFFRQGDKITLVCKISNQSDASINGTATLTLTDAMTGNNIDTKLANNQPKRNFEAKSAISTTVSWDLIIPDDIEAVSVKIIAKAGNYSDGEEKAIPVLTNRMLVTESLPLPIKGNEKKTFEFTKLVESGKSTSLKNHKFTLEFTSNPAWYAIQALPYIIEYPYECSEQVFSRYYGNSIAHHIVNSNPKIKAVFDSWAQNTPQALLSNLEKNQELKALILEETPWLIQGKNESERKRNIALLFDLNKMASELDRAFKKLRKLQTPNGGWAWFDGMPDNRYITQHIVTGFGHLDKLGVKNIRNDRKCWNMIEDGVKYLDDRMREDYNYLKRYYPKELDKMQIGYLQIQYLYARSYFINDIKISDQNKEAFNYYYGQAQKYWLQQSIYMQGMIALATNRLGDKTTPTKIVKSLKERALHSDEMGMYWKDVTSGYYWYQAPIETQALMIEMFDEVANDVASVEELKIWLLKQKQTQDWKTTKATVEACYALLLRGNNLLASDKLVQVSLGNQIIDPRQMDDVKIEAGTGYFKTSWSKEAIKSEMGIITVEKKDDGIAWGAVYWQYFEDLDKITPAETPLKLQKKLFVERMTNEGAKIEPVTEQTKLKVGDKIKVRIELRVDRDMEYVHMKDMRASAFEPVNVLSGYKYQGGLGYYESTRDAATNFFFYYLQKGTYVFEYPLFVTHKGDFSNGITTIQCMYAPEFTSHSEGIRVTIVE